MKIGAIEGYACYELGEMPLRETLSVLRSHLVGLKAVNTSFDSGLFVPSVSEMQNGWSQHGRAGVSPAITQDMLLLWPLSHDEYCDEWWFFGIVPPDFDFTHGFCNMVSQRIGQWEEVDFCTHLAKAIKEFQPELIIGNNTWTYVVAKQSLRELEAQPAAPPNG